MKSTTAEYFGITIYASRKSRVATSYAGTEFTTTVSTAGRRLASVAGRRMRFTTIWWYGSADCLWDRRRVFDARLDAGAQQIRSC